MTTLSKLEKFSARFKQSRQWKLVTPIQIWHAVNNSGWYAKVPFFNVTIFYCHIWKHWLFTGVSKPNFLLVRQNLLWNVHWETKLQSEKLGGCQVLNSLVMHYSTYKDNNTLTVLTLCFKAKTVRHLRAGILTIAAYARHILPLCFHIAS